MSTDDLETPPKSLESKQTLAKGKSFVDEATEKTLWNLLPFLVLLGVIACASLLLIFWWAHFVDALFEAIESSEHKVEQALVINSVLVVMIVCCLPGPAFCVILDGFFFGFWRGFCLGFVFETIGYLLCILLARTCLKARLREMIMDSDILHEMVLICEQDASGKFLVLFRFLTLPVWAKNYAIGALDIDWLKAILVFLPAETYYCSIFAYIGSKGYEIAGAIRKGDTSKAIDSFSGAEVMMVSVGIGVAVLIVVLAWHEYSMRRAALAEGAHAESAPMKVA